MKDQELTQDSIGDVIDAFMAMMVLRTCQQIEGGLPNDVKAKMMFNIIVDFGIGLVPFLGDIADALFRANTKNAVVLENHLREKGLRNLKAAGHSTPPIDPTDANLFDQQLREEMGPPPKYSNAAPATQSTQNSRSNGQSASTQPAPARTGGGGWFSKTKQTDVERAQEYGRNLQQEEPRRPAGTLQKNRT